MRNKRTQARKKGERKNAPCHHPIGDADRMKLRVQNMPSAAGRTERGAEPEAARGAVHGATHRPWQRERCREPCLKPRKEPHTETSEKPRKELYSVQLVAEMHVSLTND